MATTATVDPLNFDKAFAADIEAGMQYADALEKHVTGRNAIRRAACLQTLQALASLPTEEASGLVMWARQQRY